MSRENQVRFWRRARGSDTSRLASTKSGNAALVLALLERVTTETKWTRVGKNAEMLGWTDHQLSSCPYPLTVGLERFHTPGGAKHAVLLR